MYTYMYQNNQHTQTQPVKTTETNNKRGVEYVYARSKAHGRRVFGPPVAPVQQPTTEETCGFCGRDNLAIDFGV
jgi:hypothetical protein